MATVRIPTPLRRFTDNQAEVTVAAATVGEALNSLTTTYPELQKHLRDANGKLRSFVNVYVGDEDIRFLSKEDTALAEDAEVTIVPSIAGGAS